ncbi:MAG TPA: hypothetical protein PKB04_03800, partial [Phenylobacterium sp.]|nr:hypothetical protein [Phenylobacterium sp.]
GQGSIHIDQFVPLILQAFGARWFEGGNLSLQFKKVSAANEAVRAELIPGAERARLSLSTQALDLICEGTAADHADAGSELARVLLTQEAAPREGLRILAGVQAGDEAFDIPLSVSPQALAERRAEITEPLDIYGGDDAVLPPSLVVDLAHGARSAVLGEAQGQAEGLACAVEIQFLEGPLRAGVDYMGRTRVHALTETAQAETVWYDVLIADPARGRDQARLTFGLRFLKAASPLRTNAA